MRRSSGRNALRLRATLRVVDANLNRAREGLRVLEDTARFVRDDRRATARFARLRHRLDRLARGLYPRLLAARDSRKDVARARRPSRHPGPRGLASANFRRTQESLRVLEEYSRLISGSAGAELARLRFSLYDLEKRLLE